MALHVLVPFDDSDPARAALEHAIDQFPDADVSVLAVADHSEIAPVPTDVGEQSGGEALVELASDRAESAQSVASEGDGARITTAFRGGSPAREIVDYVEEEDVNHVVIGTEGRSGVSRVLLGSVAETVVRHSPVPVTVVHADDELPDREGADEDEAGTHAPTRTD